MAPTRKKPIQVLLVEDNPADALLMKELLAESALPLNVTVAGDGEIALKRLRDPAARFDLVLLDLNLPRVDGRQVLREVKSDDELRRVPVIVLSTSRSKEDVLASYDAHANCFVTKPVDLDEFRQVVKRIEAFWFSTAELPRV